MRLAALALAALVLGAAPAAAGARSVPVRFAALGTSLSGRLILPAGRGPFPAVVMLQSAGAQTRAPYLPMARSLARGGVAALVFDKRGSGRSGGDADYRYAELVTDARAALRALRRQKRVRRDAVGLWALSEGGSIAPIVAAEERRRVKAVVVVSPSTLRPVDRQAWAVRNGVRVSGASALGAHATDRYYRVLDAAVASGLGSLLPDRAQDLRFDATRAWARVRQPVLAVWGTGDTLVPIRESAAALATALASGPNRDRTFATYRGAPHDLRGAKGLPQRTARWLRGRLTGRARRHVATTLPPQNGVVRPRRVTPGPLDRPWILLAWLLVPVALLVAGALAGGRAGVRGALTVAGPPAVALALLGTGLGLIASADGQDVTVVAGFPVLLLAALVAAVAGLVALVYRAVRRRPLSVPAVVAGVAWAALALTVLL